MIQKKKVNTFIKYGVIFTIIVFLLSVLFASVGHIPIRVLVTRLDELCIEILCTAKSELTCITDAEASTETAVEISINARNRIFRQIHFSFLSLLLLTCHELYFKG